MTAAHTFGPWHSAYKGNAKLDLGIYEPHGNLICTVQRSGSVVSLERRQADAHLIAAAPELLAALVNLVEFLEAADKSWSPDRPSSSEARAAIDKATGAAA